MHPNPGGHMVMAHALLRDMNASDTVSTIHVSTRGGELASKNQTKGSVTELQTADNISFNFLANSLPWAVPEEAHPGYQLVQAGSTLSRETLRVSDLTPGRYQLLIDDSIVGDFSHWELARGIELQGNVNTPQYQQARQVVQLNVKRNEYDWIHSKASIGSTVRHRCHRSMSFILRRTVAICNHSFIVQSQSCNAICVTC